MDNIRTKFFTTQTDNIYRGNVYIVSLPKEKQYFVQSCEEGTRPCVVVSSQAGCMSAPVVMVCPITTKLKDLSCNVTVGWSQDGRTSQVLCNQIITVPREALQRYKGKISPDDMKKVDKAIKISLGVYDYASECKHVEGSK